MDTNIFEDTSKFNEHCTTIWTKSASNKIPVYFIASAKKTLRTPKSPPMPVLNQHANSTSTIPPLTLQSSRTTIPRQAHDKCVSSALSASTSSVVQPIAKTSSVSSSLPLRLLRAWAAADFGLLSTETVPLVGSD